MCSARARPAPSPPLHAPVSSLLLSQSQKAPCPQPRGPCVCCAPAGGGLPSPRALYPGFSASQGCPNCDHDAAGSKRQRFIISSLDSSLKSRRGKAVLSAEAPGACPSRLFQLLGVPGAPRAGWRASLQPLPRLPLLASARFPSSGETSHQVEGPLEASVTQSSPTPSAETLRFK